MYICMHELGIEKQGPYLLHQFAFEECNKITRGTLSEYIDINVLNIIWKLDRISDQIPEGYRYRQTDGKYAT